LGVRPQPHFGRVRFEQVESIYPLSVSDENCLWGNPDRHTANEKIAFPYKENYWRFFRQFRQDIQLRTKVNASERFFTPHPNFLYNYAATGLPDGSGCSFWLTLPGM
jgi:hypothetical protein